MRGQGTLALGAAFAAAVAFPAAAGATTAWKGVVVAKDPARQTIVTASAGGLVRTVRAPARVRTLRVGQRVVVRAAALADGSFRARLVRASGRATKVRIRGVLVRRQRSLGRYLVSAGGSVLAIRSALRTTASAGDDGPKPGDKLVIDAALTGGTPTATSLETVGHVAVLELEGIFLGRASDGSLRLAVAHRGEVLVAVPAGTALPALTPGEEVELAVSVDAGGAFTLAHVQADDEDENEGVDVDEDDGALEVEGAVSALSAGSITVQPGENAAPVTCAIPSGVSLTGFAVGDRVEMECTLAGGGFSLTKLKREHADENDEGGHGGEVELAGTVSAFSGGSITVQGGSRSLTCAIPDGTALSGITVGDLVQVECGFVAGALVLKQVEQENDQNGDDGDD